MVTGREKVFKNDLYGNITLLNGKNVINKYILIDEYPTQNTQLNEYMLSNKSDLINRRIRKFTEKNWYEWGALRNYKTVKQNLGKECIFVNNMSRSKEICFQGKVQYFGGGLIIMVPKQKINLHKLVDYIIVIYLKIIICIPRFKIGHKQLSNSYLIFRYYLEIFHS